MITVEQLFNVDNLNVLIKEHMSEEKIVTNTYFRKLNNEIISLLASKNYNFLKASFAVEQSTDTKMVFEDELNQDSSVSESITRYCEENKIDNSFYIFVGSRVAFYNTLSLINYSPSVIQFVVAAFETIGHIKFVGPGKGMFTLFKPVDSYSVENLNLLVAGRKDFYSNSKNLKYINKILQEDCEYYKKYINDLNSVNQDLVKQVSELTKQNYLSTQMTWR
jgi:hypothetical protein